MHSRGLTTFFMTLGFILLLVTGIMLYIVPAGRVAYWVDWTFLGLDKTQWGNIHVLAGFLLLIAGFFHVYFNWRPLKARIYSKVRQRFNLKKEMVIAIVGSVILVWAAIADLPPFHYIFELSDHVKESWVTDERYAAPFGHAELLALSSFAKKQKINLHDAKTELEKNGIKIMSVKDSLGKIAKENNRSPMALYQLIQKLEPQKAAVDVTSMSAEEVEEQLTGTGLGRKNIRWALAEFKLEAGKAKRRLKKSQIDADFEESFHDIADRYGVSPMDIIKVILVKGYTL